MLESIRNTNELLKKYKLVTGRRPSINDLVYVPSQNGIFRVIYADRMNVRIERGHKGSGLLLTLPFSHYKLVEKR
jgi:hypothetical protein